MKYEIEVNPIDLSGYATLNDGERFVTLDTNIPETDVYAVIDADDADVMANLQAALERRFGSHARVIGFEDASWMFDEFDE